MPRNAEVIRQWTILREIESARAAGVTIDDLASLCDVTTRTIRRDLQALEEAGFPIFDDRSRDDGRTRWSINGQAFKGLAAGLTLSELCALYFSRTLVESLSGTPFRHDVEQAFDKLSSVLTPHMRQFLDQLPRVISTKADPLRLTTVRRPERPAPQESPEGPAPQEGAADRSIVARVLEATLHSRQATLLYHSRSSDRTKSYLVHPYRLAYAKGGMYVLAYVPEYGEIRTFALERIEDISLLEERFTPVEELPDAAFPHSLGVHSGPPERVEIEFSRDVADYVKTREWHESQVIAERPGGAIALTLNVCLDRALESWILSFGAGARVVFPESLATKVASNLQSGADAYARRTVRADLSGPPDTSSDKIESVNMKMARMQGGGGERSGGSRRGAAAAAASLPAGMPGAGAKKKKFTAGAWEEAQGLIWVHRKRLALGLGLMLVNRLAGMVMPYSTRYFMDDVAIQGHWDLLPTLAVAVGLATVVDAVTSFANSQVLGVAAQRAITDMRKEVEAHVMRLPISYFDSTKSGVLISRIMSDAEGIRNLVGTGLVQLTGSILTAFIATGILFYLNWKLTVVTLLILVVFGGGMAMAFKRLRPLFRERGQINAEVTGRLNESLGGVRIVKSYVAEKREELVFARGAHRLFRNVAQSLTGVSAVTASSSIVIGACGIAMMLIGGNAIKNGTMTIGMLFQYLAFTALMTMPVIQLASIGTQMSEAFAGLDRIREIRKMATEDDEDESRMPINEVRGDIAFDDVTFEYKANTPVLKHVSFDAPAGSTTALVGSSGSGKSTLISLAMAFNRPLSGRVLVDGHDLTSVRLRDFRHNLGVVLQDNFLFDGSIAANIAYAKPHASREEIVGVSRIAHCDEFISGFEQGYDTIVGERGVRLSGGQRQRVAIARAILADPRILILDEATSSLDSESEALIQDGLRSLRQGRTTFVIAHRLSTIRSADQILVLEHGEIVERGSHDELLGQNGRYRQLYDKQYRFEKDRFINPGEDFTPEPERAAVPRRASTTL